jgi:hypothetical protein
MAEGTTLAQNARLFALLNMAVSDGLETSYASKYFYTLWRPITAIRDPRSGLINPATQSDPTWTTLHPTTPAFPTYASNAGTEGGSAATLLASFFGTDNIPFQVHWDAYGFPGVTRSYTSFSAAEAEEGRSRVYGGIHFTFDVTAGQGIGRHVARYVFRHVLLPRSDRSDERDDGEDDKRYHGDGSRTDREADSAAASARPEAVAMDPALVQTVLVSPLSGALEGGQAPTPFAPAPLPSGTPLVTGLTGNGVQTQSAGTPGGVPVEGPQNELIDRLWTGFDGSLSAAGGWDDLTLRPPR